MLVVVVWRTGTGPFVDGVSSLDGAAVALGVTLALVSTLASAWRWHLVADGLGVGVPVPTAVASCYRAQFLNTVLPGGVVGDVHRGVVHGRDAGDTGRGLRAVAWERSAGQVVLVAVTAVVLVVLPSPVGRGVPAVAGLATALLVAGLLLARRRPAEGTTGVLRLVRVAHDDVRSGPLGRRSWPGVALASVVAVACYVATYVVAARTVGVDTGLSTLLPLALLVLVAAGLPLSVAGWGPREGAAAWVFAAAGLGADQGVAAAVAYGAIVLVANLPGAVVLLATGGGSGG